MVDGADGDEGRLLATLSLSSGELTVQRLTESHLDEVLTALRTALPGCRVVHDERRRDHRRGPAVPAPPTRRSTIGNPNGESGRQVR